ncbi:MAG TPA: sulfate adenylyltransferase subunit CysN [Methylomirabilota bacterium]|jgi:bifunctional enzyme CysN/CysC|nr:sulfate adenylyltransferase subunit CysN [Methylomirabilota bacterium]
MSTTSITEFLEQKVTKDLLRLSTVGSVDDGKSTLIGRLLHDTKSIYEDHLAALRADSARVGSGPELDFALLTDGLKAEREQGITIDVAYRYFSSPRRHFIIADTPGHEQYTRNMATGASTANIAIILIDARHGILTQTKRHSFIAALLGIPRLLIAVNKMDLVGYSRHVFDRIVEEYTDFASRLGVADLKFIPISALLGDNVVERGRNMPWYHGESVLEYLETVYIGGDRNLVDVRLPVQYVIRPHQGFRGYAGQLASGILRRGEEILVLPSMRTSRIRSIDGPEGELDYAFAPMSVTVTLEDELDISRGDMLVHPKNLPVAQSSFEAMVVWMSEKPLSLDTPYVVKHTTRSTRATVRRVEYRVDVNTLSRSPAEALRLNEIGRLVLQTTQRLFLDPYKKNRLTGSIIVVDPISNDTVAAGMVIDRLPEDQLRSAPATLVAPRSENVRRELSPVSAEDRERLLGQRPLTLWFTGLSGSGKSSIAQELERRLQAAGRHAYSLDGDNLRLGLNRDLGFSRGDRTENLRRAAEVARLFNEAGTIVLVPVIAPFRDDRERARGIIGAERFFEVFLSTPLEVCEARDVKGLYRKARAGEIREFTGISSPYELPEGPALVVDTTGRTIQQCVDQIWRAIEGKIER